ncbi:YdiU family protein [Corynebacterium sp. 11A]|uniref:protein adenylyltransferase SelO n=1 Tax=Corynebacterium sp. 11A TaxID=2080510 RepID=UPI00124E1181|nr:protein adenylyltransferase SelO family protein [Corynebacterium sp. 11A]
MSSPVLRAEFAKSFPDLCLEWQAAEYPDASLLQLNEPLAAELGLDPQWLRTDAGLDFLCGRASGCYTQPVAQGYAGHQFGQFNPQLGDGRALLLGELDTPSGLVDLHLKGSGPTPFSRGADGYGARGPMLREYLISEAMHALGIPSTRVLAVIDTGRSVLRSGPERGAMIVRAASSHIRVGTFQMATVLGAEDVLAQLVEYCLQRHYPEHAGGGALALLEQVMNTQMHTVAQWMGVGFIHGVMNTDNTTISGETIDYGPCAFLDAHATDACFSSIDTTGRYRYGQQPAILGWNMARFGEVLLPLIDADPQAAIARAQEVLSSQGSRFEAIATEMWAAKLGINGRPQAPQVVALALDYLRREQPDHTTFFATLDEDYAAEQTDPLWQAWRDSQPDPQRRNPVVIPRNHEVERALSAAAQDHWELWEALLHALRHPFDADAAYPELLGPAPAEWTENFTTYCGT